MPRVMPFSTCREKLDNRTKCQTIRLYKESKYYQVGKPYNAWWKPRTKERKFLGQVTINMIAKMYGRDFTNQTAIDDGFDGSEEQSPRDALVETLCELNDMSRREVLNARWKVMRYRWLE